MRTHNRAGFTLIELMIVIGVIAIIAAIAIPSLLNAIRAANERNASASLKVLLPAQVDYRTNDRNGDRIANYWCSQPSGLYVTKHAVSGLEVRLIDLSMALADADADQNGGGSYPAVGSSLDGTRTSPKAGYWYEDFEFSETGDSYDPDDDDHHPSRFGYMAWPNDFGGSGNFIFIINQNGVVYRSAACAPGSLYEVQGGSAKPNNMDIWPGGQAGPLSTGLWSKLD